MRSTTKFLITVAASAVVLMPTSPASSGKRPPEPLSVTGVATCISGTEVQVDWTAQNIEDIDQQITAAQVITHGNLPVTMSPLLLSLGESATGSSMLPEGPGTATLRIDSTDVFDGPASVDLAGRQSRTRSSFGSVELPDCPDPTTTTTTTTTALAPTTAAPTSTTTTAPPAVAPITATPDYTG